MPGVGHLPGLWRSGVGAVAEGAGAVAADNPHLEVFAQPGGEPRRKPDAPAALAEGVVVKAIEFRAGDDRAALLFLVHLQGCQGL